MIRKIYLVVFAFCVTFQTVLAEGDLTQAFEGLKNDILENFDLEKFKKLDSDFVLKCFKVKEGGFSLLHAAAYKGDLEFIDRLLKAGFPIDEPYADYYYPLDFAILSENIKTAKFLIVIHI